MKVIYLEVGLNHHSSWGLSEDPSPISFTAGITGVLGLSSSSTSEVPGTYVEVELWLMKLISYLTQLSMWV